MGFQWWQLLLIAVLVMLLFGRGKISSLMGDVAEGIKSFKKGMREDDADTKPEPVQSITAEKATKSESTVQTNSKAETKV